MAMIPPKSLALPILVWMVCYNGEAMGRTLAITETMLENFYQCPDHKNTTVVMKDVYVKRISSTKRKAFGKLIMKESIEDAKGKMEMYKCSSKSEPDTCEYYTELRLESLCDSLRNRQDPWTTWFKSTTLPPTCPLQKGNWEIKGFQTGLPAALPLLPGFWKLKTKGYNMKNKLVSCFIVEMTIISHFG